MDDLNLVNLINQYSREIASATVGIGFGATHAIYNRIKGRKNKLSQLGAGITATITGFLDITNPISSLYQDVEIADFGNGFLSASSYVASYILVEQTLDFILGKQENSSSSQ